MSRNQLFETSNDFASWTNATDRELGAFQNALPPDVRTRLDFTPSSFDALETWLLEQYGNSDQLIADRSTWDRSGRYVGETYRRHVGGHWEALFDDPKYIAYRLPQIVGFKGERMPLIAHYQVTSAVARRTGKYLRPLLEKAIVRAASS